MVAGKSAVGETIECAHSLMDKTLDCGSKDTSSILVGRTLAELRREARHFWRGVPNGKAVASKATARKGLQVRVLSPPPGLHSLMDRTVVSGTTNTSSILVGGTYEKTKI